MDVENLSADAEAFTANAWYVDGRALVDAGRADVVVERVDALETVVITHSHDDHIVNLPALVEAHDPAVYAYEPDNLPVDATAVDDGDTVTVAGAALRVLHTPGHRDDHICLYHDASKTLFSGDLVFPDGAFGRTDLSQGDRDALIDSIRRVTALDVKRLYAGHGAATTDDVNAQLRESLSAAEEREPKYPDA